MKESSFVSTDYHNKYTICLTKKDNSESLESKLIFLSNFKQILTVLKILEKDVSIYGPDLIHFQSIKDKIIGKSHEEVIQEYSPNRITANEVFEVIDKIGLPLDYRINLDMNGFNIDKKLVHKDKQDNVMLKRVYKVSDSSHYCFEANYQTDEIILDHVHEDHVESTILNEICRQCSTVSLNLSEKTSKIFIVLQERKLYKNFVNRNSSCIIQTISFGKKAGTGFTVHAVYQNEKLCLKGFGTGINYQNRDDYRKI